MTYVRSLEGKLQSSESRINVLADQIAHVSADTTLAAALASETAARSALADAQSRLTAYEKVLGPDPTVGEDVGRMAKQLEAKQEQLRVMDLRIKENEVATDALYGEVERLSKSWEDVASQANGKVLNLKEMEEKVARLSTEKAKADNKYFAAMRTKEAIEVERKVAQRQIEKQAKALLEWQEKDRNTLKQVVSAVVRFTSNLSDESSIELASSLYLFQSDQEKQLTNLKSSVRQFQGRIVELEREVNSTKIELDSERKKVGSVSPSLPRPPLYLSSRFSHPSVPVCFPDGQEAKLLAARTSEAERERSIQQSLQEELRKTKSELERMTAKAKIVSSGAASTGKEVELQEERNKLMVSLSRRSVLGSA